MGVHTVNGCDSLTPWSGVLLEKPTGSQLFKKFSRILWNLKIHYCIHKCLPAQSSPCPTSHFLKLHLNIPHLFLGLASGLFPLGFSTKTLHMPLPHTCCIPCLSLLHLINKKNWLLLLDSIVILKLNWTGRVISLTLPSVCICSGQISFVAAF